MLLYPLHASAVVVMSYAARLRTLPLVVNKMGSCPSGGRLQQDEGRWWAGAYTRSSSQIWQPKQCIFASQSCIGWGLQLWHAAMHAAPLCPPHLGQGAPCTSRCMLRSLCRQPLRRSARCVSPCFLLLLTGVSLLTHTHPFCLTQSSCPAVAEVLVVWNGDDPPQPSHFSSRAPVRVRQEQHVGAPMLYRMDTLLNS